MTTTVQVLESEAAKLAIDDRFRLVETILDGIDTADQEIDAAWAAEAQDRYAAWRRGELQSRPAAEVFAKYTNREA
jgi:putative addiction module component (TIGR02574 family)